LENRTSTPDRLTRATQIALIVNAVLHSAGMVGFFIGLDPHAAPLARRAAAAGLAGAVAMIVVAKRLRESSWLIALPLAFVFCNLVVTIIDFVSTGDPKMLGPAGPETLFLVLYAWFSATRVRVVRSDCVKRRGWLERS
jgi:hypothetical protein